MLALEYLCSDKERNKLGNLELKFIYLSWTIFDYVLYTVIFLARLYGLSFYVSI